MESFYLVSIAMTLTTGAAVYPGTTWETKSPADVGMDAAKLEQARDYALTGGGSGHIVRGGWLIMAWGSSTQLYDLKSSTKAIGVTALGLAIKDGKMRLSDKASQHHSKLGIPPETNAQTGWLDKITLLHLATQTAGFEKPGGYTNLLFEPGTKWHYSDGGPNWLAECITLVYGQDMNTLLFDRVFTPLGIKPSDLKWRENAYRPHSINGIKRREFGSGIHANVDAMARIGNLYLREGRWKDEEILPKEFIEVVRVPPAASIGLPEYDPKAHGNASDHYGLLWWNNADGALPEVPRDAFWSWGLYDSLTVVIPSLDIVVARAGASWKRNGDGHYEVLKPFLGPITASVRSQKQDAAAAPSRRVVAPYPSSTLIKEIVWAPKETIIRAAKGSDNWPLTWAADNDLYGAYGDGNGFEPRVPEKLSLGFAKVTGSPSDFAGVNIRSPTGEFKGDDKAGRKASGMLMVDGTLYMWARNAGNSQLAWPTDRAKTWIWSDWKFTKSFGCPTFLNFGKDYSGARDNYVYIYSHDSDSAYLPSDSMLLARVPRDRLRNRDAYEVFRSIGPDGTPAWTRDMQKRGPVFSSPGNCYRSGVTYNAGLKRYLWSQTLPGSDARFRGGFSIYDAPEPWGPWTTVYFTTDWDVGPGESSSFPSKWMSPDGKTIHLVFSGEDCFSVRKATLVLASPL